MNYTSYIVFVDGVPQAPATTSTIAAYNVGELAIKQGHDVFLLRLEIKGDVRNGPTITDINKLEARSVTKTEWRYV